MNALGDLVQDLLIAAEAAVPITLQPEDAVRILQALNIGPVHLQGIAVKTACGARINKRTRLATRLDEVECGLCKNSIPYKTAVWALSQARETP